MTETSGETAARGHRTGQPPPSNARSHTAGGQIQRPCSHVRTRGASSRRREGEAGFLHAQGSYSRMWTGTRHVMRHTYRTKQCFEGGSLENEHVVPTEPHIWLTEVNAHRYHNCSGSTSLELKQPQLEYQLGGTLVRISVHLE